MSQPVSHKIRNHDFTKAMAHLKKLDVSLEVGLCNGVFTEETVKDIREHLTKIQERMYNDYWRGTA